MKPKTKPNEVYMTEAFILTARYPSGDSTRFRVMVHTEGQFAAVEHRRMVKIIRDFGTALARARQSGGNFSGNEGL